MQMPVAAPKLNFLPLLIYKSSKPIPTLSSSYMADQPTFMAIGVSGAVGCNTFIPFLAMMSPPAHRHDNTNLQIPNVSLSQSKIVLGRRLYARTTHKFVAI